MPMVEQKQNSEIFATSVTAVGTSGSFTISSMYCTSYYNTLHPVTNFQHEEYEYTNEGLGMIYILIFLIRNLEAKVYRYIASEKRC